MTKPVVVSVYSIFAINVYCLKVIRLLYHTGISHFSPNVEKKKKKEESLCICSEKLIYSFFIILLLLLFLEFH